MRITTDDVLNVMPPQMGLFGLLFAFMNRLQAAGDAFYKEITCKQFFLLACMNLYQDEAPTANEMAETMGCSRQNVKEILNSLAKKGIIVNFIGGIGEQNANGGHRIGKHLHIMVKTDGIQIKSLG